MKLLKKWSDSLLKPTALAIIIAIVIVLEMIFLESLKNVTLDFINYTFTVLVSCIACGAIGYVLFMAKPITRYKNSVNILALLILIPNAIDQLGILFDVIFYGNGTYKLFGILGTVASAVLVQFIHLLLIVCTVGLYYIIGLMTEK